MMNIPIHLLIRFSDSLFSAGDVISFHQKVIKENGFVWFGKIGTPIAQRHIESINLQTQNKIPSFLFLVKGNRRKNTFYRANIVLLSSVQPKNERDLIPPYYFERKIIQHMKFWAKLSRIVEITQNDVQKLKVVGSVLDIGDTLVRSSSGHFIIRETTK